MRKIISILLALALLVSMLLIFVFPVPVSAATPPLVAPDLPEIPDISDDVEVDVTPSVNKWLDAHPFMIDWSMIDWSKWFR